MHVKDGFVLIDGRQGSLLFDKATTSEYGQYGLEYQSIAETGGEMGGLNFWKPFGSTNGSEGNGFANYIMYLRDNGQIGMGVKPNEFTDFTESGYRLHVRGGIISEKMKVAIINSADWADYVFEDNYQLIPLEEVQAFIDENGHLPNVPSAENVCKNGIDLGKMDAKLLEKIEELTLYMLAMKKENDILKAKVETLEKAQNK